LLGKACCRTDLRIQ
jgi:hypothetical protein